MRRSKDRGVTYACNCFYFCSAWDLCFWTQTITVIGVIQMYDKNWIHFSGDFITKCKTRDCILGGRKKMLECGLKLKS